MSEIGKDEVRRRLLKAVEEAGGQSQLAQLVGCSPGYICNVLKGRNHIYGALADLLGITKKKETRHWYEEKQ